MGLEGLSEVASVNVQKCQSTSSWLNLRADLDIASTLSAAQASEGGEAVHLWILMGLGPSANKKRRSCPLGLGARGGCVFHSCIS